MIRRILDSPKTYYGLAGVLALIAFLSMFEVHFPSRTNGTVEDIALLGRREDLNVVFVVIDTLRADRLGCYGYERPTTPVLDDLAAYGVRFEKVVSQSSWTKCSMASLWTGMYPTRTGVTRFNHALPAEALLPAERFQEAGYVTAGIWRNGWVATNFGFDQGFDSYWKPAPSRTPERFKRHSPGTHSLIGTDLDLTEASLEFIRTHGNEKFLLYVHYMDVHQYLYDDEAAKLDFGTSYSDAYDSAIHWVDRNVGELLLELERRDLLQKTLVVVASDHGEAFYEHGGEGHARNLYREVTDVPLILSLPFRLEPGIVVKGTVSNVDLWPTILELVGLSALPDADGRSLVRLIEAAGRGKEPSSAESTRPVFAYLDQNWGRMDLEPDPLVSVRKGEWHFLSHPTRDGGDELYDHREDRTEQTNRVESLPEQAAELRAEVDGVLQAARPWEQVPEVEIDEMYRAQLRALGYVEK